MLKQSNSNFVTKCLRKAILKQSRLNYLFNKQRTHKKGSTIRCNRISALIYWEKLLGNILQV